MDGLTFVVAAHVLERREDPGREIVLTRPGLAPAWRAELPMILDQRPATAALVEYVVKLYFRQMPVEADLIGWSALTGVVRLALARANGEADDAWEWAEVVA
ncbi:hypothetical protein [Hymenobacter jeollabukensis]|uniref:Uncharacterized protein n=1 Tax=Hymenobacter jeollabukensis TaxID=2025313 RepID=A0A5R8WHX4_9BACT|nr:hypothetical protein [Hymenobacter jeollabukensis]TLM87305.1 hypothetical protein FDY95_26140 [Hymenobacter jeollabukensis]